MAIFNDAGLLPSCCEHRFGSKNQLMMHPSLRWIVFAIVAVFLLFGVTLDKIAGISFYLLMLLGIVAIVMGGRDSIQSYFQNLQTYWPLHLAMSGFLICAAINQIVLPHVSSKDYNFGLYFFAFVIFFWLFLQLSTRQFSLLSWAFTIGALIATVKIYVFTNGGEFRGHPNFMPLLAYSELAATLGILALLSIDWDPPRSSFIQSLSIVIKMTAGCSGLYAIYLYQSRGAWLAIPVFAISVCIAFMKNARYFKKLAAALAIIAIIAMIYGSTCSVQQRLAQAQSDMSELSKSSNMDTSIGTRYQLWKGSLLIIKHHIGFGVGNDGFAGAMHQLADQGKISFASAKFPHSHNEFLFSAVIFGVFGIVALVLLYFLPTLYFFRHTKNQSAQSRAAALMGVVLCLSFFTDGLVDVMFLWHEAALFYTIVLSFLMAATIHFQQSATH